MSEKFSTYTAQGYCGRKKLYTYRDGYFSFTWYGRWHKLKVRILTWFKNHEKVMELIRKMNFEVE